MDKGLKDSHIIENDSKLYHWPPKKGHCYCPTLLPESFQQLMQITGDERIHLTHFFFFFTFYDFFFLIFPSHPVCTAVNIWKGEMLCKWDCCLSVVARYWQALTSKATVVLWSEHQNKDICPSFFLLLPCYSDCHWYLTPCQMRSLDFWDSTAPGLWYPSTLQTKDARRRKNKTRFSISICSQKQLQVLKFTYCVKSTEVSSEALVIVNFVFHFL